MLLDANKSRDKDVRVVEEEKILRQENTETFVLDDDRRLLICYPSDKYYMSPQNWGLSKIKNYFFRGEKPKHNYIKDNCFRTYVERNPQDGTLYTVEKGGMKITLCLPGKAEENPYTEKIVLESEDPSMYGTGDYSFSKACTFPRVFGCVDFSFFQAHKRIVNSLYIPTPQDQYNFPFIVKCDNAEMYYDSEAKTIRISKEPKGKTEFLLEPLSIVDANGAEFGGLSFSFVKETNSQYKIILSCLADQMKQAEVAFPIKLFFSMRVPEKESVVCYSYSEDEHMPEKHFQYDISKNICGRCGIGVRIYLPQLPKNAIVSQVIFEMVGKKEAKHEPHIEINKAQLSGDILVPTEDKALCDIDTLYEENNIRYSINITSFLKDKGNGKFDPIEFLILPAMYGFQTRIPSPYYGQGEMKLIVLYNDEPSDKEYTKDYSLEKYGMMRVNAYRGILSLKVKNLQYYETPFSIAPLLSYNSKYSDKCEQSYQSIHFLPLALKQGKVGRGWTFSLFCRMICGVFVYKGTRFFGYVVTLPSGEIVRLTEDKNLSLRFFDSGEEYASYYPYSDMDKQGYVYDPQTRCLFARGEIYKFDYKGLLQEIERGSERCVFEYKGSRLHRITDSWQSQLDFSYDKNGFLTQISKNFKKCVDFQYINGCLIRLSFSNGEKIQFSYYDEPEYLMQSITTVNTNMVIEHRLTIKYAASRVSDVFVVKKAEDGQMKIQKDEYFCGLQGVDCSVNCFTDCLCEQYLLDNDGKYSVLGGDSINER